MLPGLAFLEHLGDLVGFLAGGGALTGRQVVIEPVAARKDVTLWKRFMPPLPRLLGGLFAGLLMVH